MGLAFSGRFVLLALLCLSAADAADWPQWRGPGRDGLSPDVPAQLTEIKLLWKQPLNSNNHAGVAVSENRVVAALQIDGADVVRCFKTDNGEMVWSYSQKNDVVIQYGSGPRATPLIHDGRVYTVSAVGACCCLDLAKGELLWKRDFIADFDSNQPVFGFCGSPLIADGKLIVSPLGPEAAVAALDPRTGKTLWQTPGTGQPHASFIAGEFGGVSQIAGYDGAMLAGYKVSTGEKLWTVLPEHPGDYNFPTPVRVGQRLLVATENNGARLYDFEKDGTMIAKPIAVQMGFAPASASPVCYGDLIFGSGNEMLQCLDAKTLQPRWNPGRDQAVSGFAMVIAGNDRVLVLNEEGELALLAVNANGPELLNRRKICGRTWSHPALVGGKLFVRDGEALYCYSFK